jgi:flagellum-specific ATP synthase
MMQVIDHEHQMAARALKASMARHDRVRDLIPLGAYVPGADPVTDKAVQIHPKVEDFLCQGTKEEAPIAQCIAQLEKLMTT